MSRVDLLVPDLGNNSDVSVVDVLIKVGDTVEVDMPLVTLETDKASLDVPATSAGKVAEVLLKRGDKVSKGAVIARVEAGASQAQGSSQHPQAAAPAQGRRHRRQPRHRRELCHPRRTLRRRRRPPRRLPVLPRPRAQGETAQLPPPRGRKVPAIRCGCRFRISRSGIGRKWNTTGPPSSSCWERVPADTRPLSAPRTSACR